MDKIKIIEKVNLLKAKVKGDCFEYLPVVTPDDIFFFEDKFAVVIPEDLKWFVLSVANGIENKIDPTGDVINKIDFRNYYHEDDRFNPAIPFGLTKRTFWGSPEKDQFPFGPIDTEYETKFLHFRNYGNGYIDLCGYGCGAADFIVINGPEYNNIWADNFSSNSEVFPISDKDFNKNRINFDEWINRQLDNAISRWIKKPIEIKTKAVAKEIEDLWRDSFRETIPLETDLKGNFASPSLKPPKISFWLKTRRLFGI